MPSTRSPRPRVDLILFDIFDTLLRPIQPPHVQYALEARRIFSPVLPPSLTTPFLDDDQVKGRFSAAFRSLSREHPNYGKASTPRMHPDQWWEAVIRRTFDLSPTGVERHLDARDLWRAEHGMAALVERLLTRFSTAEAYELYKDVQPSLKALSRAASNSPSSLPRLGVASNSDARILSVLQHLGCDEFLSVEPQGEDIQGRTSSGACARQRDHRGRATPKLSYDIGFAKPDVNFFHQAVLLAYPFAETSLSTSASPSPSELRQACARTLYVGDSFEEDYLGATRAGLQAFWLDRSTQGGGNQPSLGTEESSAGSENGARVQSLQEVVQWALGGKDL